MKLVIITALIAVCSTAKLDRTYLPPPSANTAGGTPDLLQAPLIKASNQVPEQDPQSNTPLGSYTNDFQGVVVDAASPGVRASESELSGLGAPRPSYGSTDSKVGEAAFRGSANQASIGSGQVRPERPQSFKDRNSNILTYSNDVNHEAYSYGFETDNGIAVGENGVAVNGVQAQGGYSYMGDDGQMYKVTYVADEGGYRPQGDHLPTPHPIPEEILKSLEQNAKEEAAGVVDDGSYDAQKYNSEGDYTANKGGNIPHNGPQLSQFGNRPEGASASGSFINQSNQPFGKPNSFGVQNQPNRNEVHQFGNGFGPNQHQGLTSSQVSQNQGSLSDLNNNGQFGQHSGNQVPQFAQSQYNFDTHASQFGVQSQNNQPSGPQFGSQSQFGFGVNSGKPVKPSFGQNAVVSGNNQFANQAFKPQGPDAGFGKPSQFNQQSQYSQSNNQFQNQGPNKPLNNNNQQSLFNKFGAASSNNYNNLPQASNQYESNNEYLPPQNNFGSEPQSNGVVNSFNSVNQGLNSNRPSQIVSQVQGFQNPAGGSSPGGQLGSQLESKPDNFPSQSQSVPNKFTQNFNSQSIGQSQFNSLSTPSKPFGSSNLKPTSIPETELTTPLEPNEMSSSQSQFDGQTTVSFGSFNQPSNQFGQSQQFNSQNNLGTQQSQLSPVPTSLPLVPGKQNSGFPSGIKPQNNQRPQFAQNSFNPNQFPLSNDPYHYNQPSKPFGTPQGSRFPSSPSYQSNVGFNQNSQFNNQVSSSKVPVTPVSLAPSSPTPSSQFGPAQGSSSNFNSITQADISPFPSASSTPSTQFSTPQNNQFVSKPTFSQNSINQQQLPVSSPTSSIPSRPQFNQTPVVPQTQPTEQTSVSQTDAQSRPAVQNQQYSGTIYEYNKPAQTLPSTQSDSDSSQSIQSNTASPKPLQDEQEREPSSPQINLKPQSSFQTSQFSQNSFTQSQQVQQPQKPVQNNLRPQFGSQISGNTPSQFGQNTQSFGSQISSQQQFSQPKPSSFPSTQSTFGQVQQFQGSLGITPQPNPVPQNNLPFGGSDTAVTGYPSHEDSKPQRGPAFPTNPQLTNPIRQPALGLNNEPQPLPNKDFSQFNSKPQFSQNQFGQNTQLTQFTGATGQPIQTQFGSNSYSQQNTFGQNQNGPSPIRPIVPFGQSSAQAFYSVSQNQQNKPFSQQPKPTNQFNQNQQISNSNLDSQGSGSTQISSNEPIKPAQPSQFGSQFSGFQSSQNLGLSPKGEEFEGPRQPPSFDDKTGYHY